MLLTAKTCSITSGFVLFMGLILLPQIGNGEDWLRFRGENGRGLAADAKVPAEFGDEKNLDWKVELPGKGSSSPIVVGDKIFVTSYSGYGVSEGSGTDKSLVRSLSCINLKDGKTIWTKTVSNETTEDPYRGFITEHGYASNSPVATKDKVFAFFGKSGVTAFDFEGNQLWQVNVGTESSNMRWGSGASLITFKDLVIVNAAEEKRTIFAFNQETGKEVWKAEADMLSMAYNTPAVVEHEDGTADLVIAAPGEVWGLNPENGKLRYYAEIPCGGNVSPSVQVDGETMYIFGGIRGAGSCAVKAGGKDNITDTNVLWTSRNSSYVATPLLYEDHLYWLDDRGTAWCTSAKTGEIVYRERLSGLRSGGRPIYASPVLAGDKIIVPSRESGIFVLPAKPEYKVLAVNKFDDSSEFNATPAVVDNQLILRSDKYLYKVSAAE